MHVTRGLLSVLLEFAREADPDEWAAALSTTPAAEMEGAGGIAGDTPVFTHFYLPDAGRSVSGVFGVDLGVPNGRTRGRFVSHPDGRLSVTRTDDLHAVVLVAVPPWDEGSVRAFDRRGREQSLSVLDAEPPAESIE